MEKWFIAAKKADFKAVGQEFHIDPVTARLLRNRDLTGYEEIERYLYGSISDLHDPHLLKDGLKAASVIKRKIEEGKKIRIISDYDCDGVCSNYILVKGLKHCNALVDYVIPHRVEDGYGINEEMIRQAYEDGIDTIITCDNGISAIKQTECANRLGMTVIITDHHDIPFREEEDGGKVYQIPSAAAVINPKQSDCRYPFKSICGAVVAFKFMELVYEALGIDPVCLEEFYEICALATVCDVMPLVDENRILVREGLKRMQHSEIMGIRALIRVNNLEGRKLGSYHLGFVLGPCINASGRLSSAEKALSLLLCRKEALCLSMAQELRTMNEERKEMTRKGELEALEYLRSTGHERDKILVVYLPDLHESIAGIVAGRVREVYNKPVFVITKTRTQLKGSGRSIDRYSMYEEMSRVKDCFLKFGGHPMAAGLSMDESRLEEFRNRINAQTSLTEEDFFQKVTIDVALPITYLSEKLIREFDLLEPFGTGNEKPLFAVRNMSIRGIREIGRDRTGLKLYLLDEGGNPVEALYFGDISEFYSQMSRECGIRQMENVKRGLANNVSLTVAYYPQVNEWQGSKNIQIVIRHYRFSPRNQQ